MYLVDDNIWPDFGDFNFWKLRKLTFLHKEDSESLMLFDKRYSFYSPFNKVLQVNIFIKKILHEILCFRECGCYHFKVLKRFEILNLK